MIQGSEIIIILLVALIVLGPRRLPEVARKMGRWAVELRQAAREVTQGLEAEVGEIKKPVDEITRDFKAGVADIKEVGRDLRKPVEELKEPVKDLQDDVRGADPRRYQWKGPKPVSGPTPEDAMTDLEEIEEESRRDKAAE